MGELKKHKSVRDALQFVANHPAPKDPTLDTPVWELVARNLFLAANTYDPRVKGSITRAGRAQKMLMDRLVGTRRPGTSPARSATTRLEFVDLTKGVLDE